MKDIILLTVSCRISGIVEIDGVICGRCGSFSLPVSRRPMLITYTPLTTGSGTAYLPVTRLIDLTDHPSVTEPDGVMSVYLARDRALLYIFPPEISVSGQKSGAAPHKNQPSASVGEQLIHAIAASNAAEAEALLAPSLQKQAGYAALREYFGDFASVVNDGSVQSPADVTLAYPVSPGVYSLSTFTFSVRDGKITNIDGK